ncbi:hypothetical protein FJT64_003432 [Amphibalanus amphitrite]|uniref:Uncharacterized protein n=1 Tax=Amphibalanus amphitrite TaxID=1232801 RepID=A0A6A4W1B8_AMPAM|nr:hypothetical protein FJT64_003432 [Amphibalanus amphitrite]
MLAECRGTFMNVSDVPPVEPRSLREVARLSSGGSGRSGNPGEDSGDFGKRITEVTDTLRKSGLTINTAKCWTSIAKIDGKNKICYIGSRARIEVQAQPLPYLGSDGKIHPAPEGGVSTISGEPNRYCLRPNRESLPWLCLPGEFLLPPEDGLRCPACGPLWMSLELSVDQWRAAGWHPVQSVTDCTILYLRSYQWLGCPRFGEDKLWSLFVEAALVASILPEWCAAGWRGVVCGWLARSGVRLAGAEWCAAGWHRVVRGWLARRGVRQREALSGVRRREALSGVRRREALSGVRRREALSGVRRREALSGVRRREALSGVRRREALSGVRRREALSGVRRREALSGVCSWTG